MLSIEVCGMQAKGDPALDYISIRKTGKLKELVIEKTMKADDAFGKHEREKRKRKKKRQRWINNTQNERMDVTQIEDRCGFFFNYEHTV